MYINISYKSKISLVFLSRIVKINTEIFFQCTKFQFFKLNAEYNLKALNISMTIRKSSYNSALQADTNSLYFIILSFHLHEINGCRGVVSTKRQHLASIF